jgi:hypothetical protein
MKRTINIFKSLKEQEDYHLKLMKESSVADRFRRLLQMQQFSLLVHPSKDKSRKIKIEKWTS